MDAPTTLRRLARLEYAALRLPLSVLDDQVVRRLPARSLVRTSFERSLDALDDAARRLLTNPEQPTQSMGGTAAAQQEHEQVDELTEELLDQEQTETFAGELAEDAELRRVQAELNAKRLIEEQREQ